VSPDLKEAFIVDKATVQKWKLERDFLRRVLTGGRQVKRYYIERPETWVIYAARDFDVKVAPNIRAYIDQFADEITCKEVKQKKHSIYALHRARSEQIFTKKAKFLGVITEDEIIVAPDDAGTFATDGLYLFGVRTGVEGNYLKGILNSRLFIFIYRLLALESGRVLAQVKPTILNQLPIRTIDHLNPRDEARHGRIVQFIDQMLISKKQLAASSTERDKTFYESKCAPLDRQIDNLVYELYDLTPDEIAIVEEGNK
jgi:adenine-specific DNA-methyltransferase